MRCIGSRVGTVWAEWGSIGGPLRVGFYGNSQSTLVEVKELICLKT